MAIIKDIETKSGAIASFWRIGNQKINDLGSGKISITLFYQGWLNKEAFENGKPFIEKRQYTIEGVKNYTGNVYEFYYTELMKLSEFENAESDEI